jgi:hypothetical protein
MNLKNKLTQRVKQMALGAAGSRPVAMYLAFLCTFWLVHWPLTYLAFRALNVSETPTTDPRFHHVLALSRTIANAPIWSIYRLPYWVSESLFHCRISYLWINMMALAVLGWAGIKVLCLVFAAIRRIRTG